MKKINLKDKSQLAFIIIGVSLILLVLGIILLITLKRSPSQEKIDISTQTSVYINDPYKDAKKITSRRLSKAHCVEDVCIKDLTIYYTKEYTNVELKVINKGRKPVSGYLKVIFDKKSMTVAYKDLARKKVLPYTIQYGNYKITDTRDFKVRKLTSEELAKIKK